MRGIIVYCANHTCSHSIAVSVDQWPDDRQLSDIEHRFICAVCGKRGADVRPDFNSNVNNCFRLSIKFYLRMISVGRPDAPLDERSAKMAPASRTSPKKSAMEPAQSRQLRNEPFGARPSGLFFLLKLNSRKHGRRKHAPIAARCLRRSRISSPTTPGRAECADPPASECR